MARIPSLGKLLIENYPNEVKKWIAQLLEPLNKFIEDTTRALNNQLTVADNFNGMFKTVVIDGTYPVYFKWERKQKPAAIWIGQCRETDEVHTTHTDAPYCDWEFTADGRVQINDIVNVTATASNKFNVTLVCLVG